MKNIISCFEMKSAEDFTINSLGLSEEVLMERAALSCFDEIKIRFSKDSDILIICGGGNNGGDGYALARILAENDYYVSLYSFSNPKTNLCKKQFDILCRANELLNKVNFINSINEQLKYDLIVDAGLGIGCNRALNNELSIIYQTINKIDAFKLAVDVPTGLNADDGSFDTCFYADLTITFGYYKKGLFLQKAPLITGEIILKEIGILSKDDFESYKAIEEYDLNNVILRPRLSHKGTFGKVLVIAGSENIYGACYLSSKAAFLSGAGMVKIITHKNNAYSLEKELPEAMYYFYEDKICLNEIINSVAWCDSIAIGPGLSTDENAFFLLKYLIEDADLTSKTLVIDADGINILSQNKDLFFNLSRKIKNSYIECVMTPHKKELMRLLNALNIYNRSLEEACKKIFDEYRIMMVLKDSYTKIFGEEDYINLSGNSGLATAGSGDVLTGLISGFAHQILKNESFSFAVSFSVYIHGLLSDRISFKKSESSLIASDLINEIPLLMKEIERVR